MHATVEAIERRDERGLADSPVGLAAKLGVRHADPGEAARVQICGIGVDALTEDEAIGRIATAALSGEPLQVCTVNLQFLVASLRDRRIHRILGAAGLNVPDGAPLLWLARLCGAMLPERVAGADLVPRLMDAACSLGLRVFFLGGQGGVAADAAGVLRFRHPGLRIVGTHQPAVASLEGMDNDTILEEIRSSGADILLVAFGHPRQELWIAANRRRLAAPVAIGVGGTFDLLSGRSQRAPRWMGRIGLEWLFRLVHEPHRLWRRYASELVWLGAVLAPRAAAQRWRHEEPVLQAVGRALDAPDHSTAGVGA